MLRISAMLYLLAGLGLVCMVYPDLKHNPDWADKPVSAQAIGLIAWISFWPVLLVAAYYRTRTRKE